MTLISVLKKRKAVSSVVATLMLIAITVTAAGIIFGTVFGLMNFRSKIMAAGEITAEDRSDDGLVDYVSIPLMNRGLSDATIEAVQIKQNDKTLLWYTFDEKIAMNEIVTLQIYSLGELQQVKPMLIFQVEIDFDDYFFTSYGYIVLDSNFINDPNFDNDEVVVLRTADDDVYAKANFPATAGYSPRLWFILGEFEDDASRPDLDKDFISFNGHGTETAFRPYLLNNKEFFSGEIGVQTNHRLMPYNDSGNHIGLISFNSYGNWDKKDLLNWDAKGIVYMWSYVYWNSSSPLSINIGANGASEFKVWFNEEYLFSGNNKYIWYTSTGLQLQPGYNLIMMKLSAGTDAHFAGQVLFYNDAVLDQLATLTSEWPYLADII